MREAKFVRETKETKIQGFIHLEGTGVADVHTGIGFFDHMLTLLAFHSQVDIQLEAQGDLEVCDHHTIEDCGIVLGRAFKEALQDKVGIARYGTCLLPMDEVLCRVVLDFSGRPYLVYECDCQRDTIGTYSCEMTEEFFRAFATEAGLCLHMHILYGKNDHHKIEALFKAFAKAIKQAIQIQSNQVSSSKGVLE